MADEIEECLKVKQMSKKIKSTGVNNISFGISS